MEQNNSQLIKKSTDEEIRRWFKSLTDDVPSEIRRQQNPEIAAGLELNEKEKELIVRHNANLRTGFFSSIPLKCPGSSACKMASDCPLAALQKEPEGEPCPIEKEILIGNTMAYIEEYKVDPLKDFGKYTLLMSLARYDIYIKRATHYLADSTNGEVMKEYIIGVDQEGQPITTIDVNRAFSALKDFENQRLKIIKELVGTHKEQYKRDALMKIASKDPGAAVYLNRVKQVADDLYAGLESKKETVIDIPGSE